MPLPGSETLGSCGIRDTVELSILILRSGLQIIIQSSSFVPTGHNQVNDKITVLVKHQQN